MYEEWIEVMSDYSTVFSEGRGVSEHHYDKDRENGGEEDGGDPSGNANVSGQYCFLSALCDENLVGTSSFCDHSSCSHNCFLPCC
jgi:hypothetical protein